MIHKNKEILFFFNDNDAVSEIYPNTVAHAYLNILNDDLESSKLIFSRISSPRAAWGTAFVSILQGYLEEYPTFFQIRNFLEIDIDFLLKNNKISYVEQILGALSLLSTINQETYKFTARVMYENKLFAASLKYMEQSKLIYYNDPELHFMFAKYYLDKCKYRDAYFYISECLRLLPEYYPAKLLKEEIEKKYL